MENRDNNQLNCVLIQNKLSVVYNILLLQYVMNTYYNI